MNSFCLKYTKACNFSHIPPLPQIIQFHWLVLRFAKVWPASHFFFFSNFNEFCSVLFQSDTSWSPKCLIPIGNTPSFSTKKARGHIYTPVDQWIIRLAGKGGSLQERPREPTVAVVA